MTLFSRIVKVDFACEVHNLDRDYSVVLCSRQYRENAKFICTLNTMTARTKNALLFGYKKWLALARHTFVRMCNAFLCSRKYRLLEIYLRKSRGFRTYQRNIVFAISKSVLEFYSSA